MPVLGSKVFKVSDNMNIDEDDEDEKEPLALVKQKYMTHAPDGSPDSKSTGESKNKTPRAVVARPPTSHGSKKASSAKKKTKPALVFISDSSSDDEILSKIASPNKSKVETTPKKRTAASSSTAQTPKRTSPTKTGSPSRPSPRNPFSPHAAKQKRFQIYCTRLAKLWPAANGNEQPDKKAKKMYNAYAQMVVSSLQKSEIERIPDPAIRADIVKRHAAYSTRMIMQRMTEEERRQYLKEKHAAQRENQKQKLENERKRYEDSTLDAGPLPPPKPVNTLEVFSSSEYGEILMIINFIRSYASLLTPKEKLHLTPDEFASALADSENGHGYVAKVLLILLHALIHDEEALSRQELGVKLADLELNSSTVGELVRLCLRKQHDGHDDDEDGSVSSTYVSSSFEAADEELLEEISGTDFWDLSPSSKLKLVVALSNRLLTSVALENYIVDVHQQYCDAITERNTAAQDYNKFTKENKNEIDESKSSTGSLPVTNVEEQDDIGDDIISKVKRRRVMAEERAKRETEERAQEGKRKEKELAEHKMRSRVETANKKLQKATALKKSISRMEPLGTDRNHSRYWYFKWLPFVFVEKGWTLNSCDGQSDRDESSGGPFIETTFPRRGPNEWYFYETVEDVKKLMDTLCTLGVRESKLKERLSACCEELKATIQNKRAVDSVQQKDEVSIVEDFKTKLINLETSIRAGGLGGINEFEAWRSDFDADTTVAKMAEKMVEVSNGVRRTLLCGILNPEIRQGTQKEVEEGGDSDMSDGMRHWREAALQCKTWSRLHVLMSMLRSCIRWDRSLEHAKCRICRKQQDDELALVCDICNDVYHTYCLRPPLKRLPQGEWFCKSCKPRPAPRKAKETRPKMSVNDDVESNKQDNGPENVNTECTVCGEGEFDDQSDELIRCSTCSNAFHCNCHSPPLRHKPRGSWRCSQCVSGREIHSARLRSRVEREGGKTERTDAGKALVNLFNRDLFDDEASSADSGSVSSEQKRKLSR